MNRRRFLELLGAATVGSTVAYSFPSIIVPRNIAVESMWVYPTLYGYPHGLAHLISTGRVLQGYDTSVDDALYWTSVNKPFVHQEGRLYAVTPRKIITLP